MKRIGGWLRYLVYFRFNPLLGLLLLRDEIIGERRYGLRTTDFIPVNKDRIRGPAREDAFSYMPSNYRLLEACFQYLHDRKGNGSFLDIGAGQGRAMIVAAHFGYTDLWGVEIDPHHAAKALQLWKAQAFPSTSFVVHQTDAAYFKIPDHIQTLFFYNPFRETVMQMVVAQILSSYARAPRPVYIIYLNPLFTELLEAAGFEKLESFTRFRYVRAVIYAKIPRK